MGCDESTTDNQITPRLLFDQLNRPEVTGIQQLWPHQIEVLDRYFADLRQSRAVGIELPTGSGKTLIGLLVLEWARRQGKRVAVLTSSKALAADVAAKAEALQIPTVVVTGTRGLTDEEFRERSLDLRQYKRKLAIGVMNYWPTFMEHSNRPIY